MPFSVQLELEDGGTVTYDNVVSCIMEETEPSPDEVPEDGDEERETEDDVEMSVETNPMWKEEQEKVD